MNDENNLDLEIDHMGDQLVQVESLYLDGEYDRETLKRRIQQAKAVIGQQIYFMGRDLIMLKERCQHGQFLEDLAELGIAQRTAHRYMTVAIKFNSPKMQQLIKSLNGEKGVFSKLLELSTEGDEDLEALVDGGTVAGLQLDEIDRMSAKELREALRQAKQTAAEEKETNDRLLAEKNTHADELAKKLAKAQELPEIERWKEQQAVFDKEMSAFSLDAEELLNTVHSLILTVNIPADGQIQAHSARKSMAIHAMNRVNALANKLGQMQNDVFAEFSEFINEPTYELSDPLSSTYTDQDELEDL